MTIAADDHDVPIPYMQRTRDYYQALGFAPYRWAHFAEVPFAPLAAPLARTRVALITTAAPYQPGVGDQGPGAKYNAAAKFYKVYSDSTESIPDLRISHVGYDRVHTTADDQRTWLPLAALQTAVKTGRIGALTSREQLILRLRYGLGGEEEHTLEQIGQSLGLSRERVRQLEARALKKLRETLPAQNLHPILEP